MESLSSYDYGKKDYEGRRYIKDINASKHAMGVLLKPIEDYNADMRKWKMKQYKPEMHLTLGNHEYRIERAVQDDPKLDGFMSIDDLGYESFGWIVHPFLEVVELDGIYYSHYFCNPLSGRAIGGESILLRLKSVGFSHVQGHQQIYLSGARSLNSGRVIRGIVLGSCYLHDEKYRGPQSNSEFRGILVFHEVINGNFSLMEISIDYLCRRYEGMMVWEFMEKKYPDIFNRSTWMKHQKKNSLRVY
jgi:hypothetical protein